MTSLKWLVLLCLFALTPVFPVGAAEPLTMEIHLVQEPSKALSADRGRALHVSEYRASKFRVVPGLSSRNTNSVSLELVGAKNFFLRHQEGIIKAHERPKKINLLFEGDASWKIIKLAENRIRIESVNYPGDFITVREDGNVVKSRNPPLEKSTFMMTLR